MAMRLLVVGAIASVCIFPGLAAAVPAQAPKILVSTAPGSLVRWSAPGTKRCGMARRTWPPLGETCYYPIDILQKPGVIRIVRWGLGPPESVHVAVGPSPYGTEEIDLGDIPQGNPSAQDLARNAREQAQVAKVWKRKEGPPKFTLPLGNPARPLPEPKTFGWNRVFNGKPSHQPHMGADYAMPEGTPVLAVADGTVALAADLFFPGKAVFIDHGDGLFTMYFHLSEIKVDGGQAVAKGDTVGRVGSTGRSSGSHLFFGVRWHGARINPQPLLEDPNKIPSVGQ